MSKVDVLDYGVRIGKPSELTIQRELAAASVLVASEAPPTDSDDSTQLSEIYDQYTGAIADRERQATHQAFSIVEQLDPDDAERLVKGLLPTLDSETASRWVRYNGFLEGLGEDPVAIDDRGLPVDPGLAYNRDAALARWRILFDVAREPHDPEEMADLALAGLETNVKLSLEREQRHLHLKLHGTPDHYLEDLFTPLERPESEVV